MTDPPTLRAQAEQLRRVARAIREKAAALDDELGTLQRRYPLRAGGVWEGPYADGCEAKATQLDAQAGDLEQQRRCEHQGAR
ncbi:MAG TPA: hypothetical protein VNP20_05775 [Nocardioidaceae bacterium]|nr:hypothetical protein [Nocardioidaceae bacterium]